MKLRLPQAIAAVTLAAGLVFAPVAANATYVPSPGPSTGSTVTIAAGGSATISFVGFQPGEPVRFTLTGEFALSATLANVKFAVQTANLGTKAANSTGAVSPTITLPSNATGSYTLTATGATSAASSAVTITVGDPTLPNTGGDSGQLLGLWIGGGALLLAGGGIAVATTVRRQRGQVTA